MGNNENLDLASIVKRLPNDIANGEQADRRARNVVVTGLPAPTEPPPSARQKMMRKSLVRCWTDMVYDVGPLTCMVLGDTTSSEVVCLKFCLLSAHGRMCYPHSANENSSIDKRLALLGSIKTKAASIGSSTAVN